MEAGDGTPPVKSSALVSAPNAEVLHGLSRLHCAARAILYNTFIQHLLPDTNMRYSLHIAPPPPPAEPSIIELH